MDMDMYGLERLSAMPAATWEGIHIYHPFDTKRSALSSYVSFAVSFLCFPSLSQQCLGLGDVVCLVLLHTKVGMRRVEALSVHHQRSTPSAIVEGWNYEQPADTRGGILGNGASW